jgi:hypothetical protein
MILEAAMPLGAIPDPAILNGDLSALAQRWRDTATSSQRFRAWALKLDDAGLAAAFGIAAGDVAQVRAFLDYMGGDMAGLWFGTVPKGSPPAQFNYDDALSAVMPPP